MRAVQRTAEFSQDMIRAASEVKEDMERRGVDPTQLSDERLAQELENSGVQFERQSRRPKARDFLEGPDETTPETLADLDFRRTGR